MDDNQLGVTDANGSIARRAATQKAGTSKPTEAPRVLFVVSDSSQPPARALAAREVLIAEGYEVAWLATSEVLSGHIHAAPDVVLIDSGAPSTAEICAHLKSENQDDSRGALDAAAPILVLIADAADMEALSSAGADEFINADSSALEIQARFATAVRLARLKRELQATRERLSRQIQVDDLTQVLNRRFFFQSAYRECSRARRYAEPLSCLMVDVDHFHLYNTSFGYSCGDIILREVANILKTCVRDTDLVARFGGSKFVILLTHTDVEGAAMVRQKMESLIGAKSFVWHHQQLPVTVSIGEAERIPGRTQTLAEGDEDSHPLTPREDLAELLEDADSALFVAKKGARFPSFIETSTPPQA